MGLGELPEWRTFEHPRCECCCVPGTGMWGGETSQYCRQGADRGITVLTSVNTKRSLELPSGLNLTTLAGSRLILVPVLVALPADVMEASGLGDPISVTPSQYQKLLTSDENEGVLFRSIGEVSNFASGWDDLEMKDTVG
jgi:hypothetical protein